MIITVRNDDPAPWTDREYLMSKQNDILQRFKDAQDALVLQASDLSLETIASMVENDAIDIKPLFQRRERWDVKRQSALIESFLLNIPVPPVYLAEDDFGKYSVIDGKQRITAIYNYMRDMFPLALIEKFPELEGLSFKQLPPALRNALMVRPYVRAITILRQSDRETKYEVFHRLNSGGEPLNAQEIRNVLYRGPFNDALIDLSSSAFLRKQLKIKDSRSPVYKAMGDVEYVLRYFTLRNDWENFSGDYRRSMDTFMSENAHMEPDEIEEHRSSFTRALHYCEAIWGTNAFKRPDKDVWRDQTLAGMYDAQMVAVDLIEDQVAEIAAQRKARVLRATRELFNDEEFEAAVRVATNTPARVRYRVEQTIEVLETITR